MSRYHKRSASPGASLPQRKHARPAPTPPSSANASLLPPKIAPPIPHAVYGYLLHADNAALPENLIMPLDKKGLPEDVFFRWIRRRLSPIGKELVLIKLDRYWTLAAFSSDTAVCKKNTSVAAFLSKDIRAAGAVVLYKRAEDRGGDGDETERIQVLHELAEPRHFLHMPFDDAVEATRARIREQLEKQMAGSAVRQSSSSE